MWCEEPNENVLKTNGTKFYDKKEQKDIAHPERNKYWKEASMFLYCFSLFNSEQSEGRCVFDYLGKGEERERVAICQSPSFEQKRHTSLALDITIDIQTYI